jgi:hypothetical protein
MWRPSLTLANRMHSQRAGLARCVAPAALAPGAASHAAVAATSLAVAAVPVASTTTMLARMMSSAPYHGKRKSGNKPKNTYGSNEYRSRVRAQLQLEHFASAPKAQRSSTAPSKSVWMSRSHPSRACVILAHSYSLLCFRCVSCVPSAPFSATQSACDGRDST